MKTVFLDAQWMDDLDLSAIESQTTSFNQYQETAEAERVERCVDAEVIITNKVMIDRGLMEQCPKLRLICIIATGTNNVDLVAAKDLGIAVCNCVAYGVESVAQHVMAMIFSLNTQLVDYNNAVKQGRWQQANTFCMLDYPIREVHSLTLGILGYGHLGKAVEKMALALGMKVLVSQRPNTPAIDDGRVGFEQMVAQADVISLHCPLTAETENLFDETVLAAMKPNSFLINCARGGIVNESALVAALKSGHLAGAATDVLTQEPPVNGNPLLAKDIPNLIITPHSAWGSEPARQRIIAQTAENIEAFSQGSSIRRVA